MIRADDEIIGAAKGHDRAFNGCEGFAQIPLFQPFQALQQAQCIKSGDACLSLRREWGSQQVLRP